MRYAKIGDVVLDVRSWNPQREASGRDIEYIDLGAIDNETKLIMSHQTVLADEAPSRARQKVQSGDILISTVRPYLNGVARVPDNLDGATASTGFCVVRVNKAKASPEYLFQWFKSPQFIADMTKKATGASYPAVSDRIIFESNIPLPSLDEQRRIAAILDQADALRRKRRLATDHLMRMPVSLFNHLFGDPINNERGWDTVRLGGATTKIGSGATPTGGEAAYKSHGVSLIRSMNVHDGRFVMDGLAHIDDKQAEKLSNVVVQDGDVLLNITGASVARVCRVPELVLPARVNQHVSIIRPTCAVAPEFLEVALLHPSSKAKLLKIGEAGATRQAITKEQIEKFEMIVPPRPDQERFVNYLRLLSNVTTKSSLQEISLEVLFSSLQQSAFGLDGPSPEAAALAAE